MRNARVKIFYALAWMEFGGSQTHLLQVLRHLDRNRFEPFLYCLTGRGALLPAAAETGAPVVDGGMRRGFRPLPLASGVLGLARILRRERVDVVHGYLLRANIVAALAGRLARVPVVVVSKRGCHQRRGFELAGARLSNRLATCVTANSQAVRDFVAQNERCPKSKIAVIPSGIDTERFRPLPPADYKRRLGLDPERPVVGSVTRMRVRKGVEEFLRAMAVVREKTGAQTVVAGEVTLDPELERLVADSGLGADLHLLGPRRDIPEVLSAFDVFVLSSHGEGMSNAILEAMAMRLPVVATGAGGTVEVVRDGSTGLLVPPRDPERLAAAVLELLARRERWAEMGKLGREVVERNFSATAMVRQMEELYARLLEETGAGVPAASGLETVGDPGRGGR